MVSDAQNLQGLICGMRNPRPYVGMSLGMYLEPDREQPRLALAFLGSPLRGQWRLWR